jgi:two-component system, chemotaxis family, CheB/CheR fusion protein
MQLLEIADRIMLSAYAPAAVVIDQALHVEQFRGRTDDYLEQIPGPAKRNLLQLVRPSMVADLRAIIDRAIKTDKPARKERALVKFEGKTREVNIEVVPFKLPASDKSWLLVIFDEITKGTRPERLLEVLGRTTTQREMSEMRRELTASQSDGQELLSRNEELQLMNEELETAKEELQSTNEELTTLNDELSNRNLEMMQLTSDLDNLLTSVQIPIVMVDRALMVRRATPAARHAFNILPTDIGRRITELRPNIDPPDLENILGDVIETLGTRERKVTDKQGREYSLRVHPYRSIDNKIDGAVTALVDLEEKKDSYAGKTLRRVKQASPRK